MLIFKSLVAKGFCFGWAKIKRVQVVRALILKFGIQYKDIEPLDPRILFLDEKDICTCNIVACTSCQGCIFLSSRTATANVPLEFTRGAIIRQ